MHCVATESARLAAAAATAAAAARLVAQHQKNKPRAVAAIIAQ
jgi:hypothetical protein